jgi:hypothetical protein
MMHIATGHRRLVTGDLLFRLHLQKLFTTFALLLQADLFIVRPA